MDLTAFRYSDFGRLLICYSPPETVPETVKKPLLAIFFGVRPYFVVYLPDYTAIAARGISAIEIDYALGIAATGGLTSGFALPIYFFLFRHGFSELPRPIALKLYNMVGI